MKFVTFERRKGSPRGGLLLPGNRYLDLGLAYSRSLSRSSQRADDTSALIDSLRGLSSSLLEILQIGDDSLTECFTLEKMALAGNLEDCAMSKGDVTLLAPLPDPPAVLCFNGYRDHAALVARELHGRPGLPAAWSSVPHFSHLSPTAVVGTGSSVMFRQGETQPDFEVHLAAVLGEDVYHAPIEDVVDAVLGYTLAIVWVGRQAERDQAALMDGCGTARGFAVSMGPVICTREEIEDLEQMKLTVRVQGREILSAPLGAPEFSPAEMISYASELNRISAGSIILTGCVPGATLLGASGMLNPADLVEARIDQIGVLSGSMDGRRVPHFLPRRPG